MRASHDDVSDCVDIFIQDRYLFRYLDDLKWVRHVRNSWNAWKVTPGFWISARSVSVVFVPPRQGLRPIRDFVANHDALSCRHAVARRVVLNVPRSGTQHLPDTGQMRPAVRRPAQALGRDIRGTQCQDERSTGHDHESILHATLQCRDPINSHIAVK